MFSRKYLSSVRNETPQIFANEAADHFACRANSGQF